MFLLIYVSDFTEISFLTFIASWLNFVGIMPCILSNVLCLWWSGLMSPWLMFGFFFFFNKIKQGFSLDGKDNELP